MADHRPWLKLWKTAYSDPSLEALSLEDMARWMRLLLFVGINGEGGSITLPKGTEHLFSCFRKRNASTVRTILAAMPGVVVTDHDLPSKAITITFTKWPKYQVDSSAERTRTWRQRTQSGDGTSASPVTTTPRHTEALGDGVRLDKTRKEVEASPPTSPNRPKDRLSDLRAERQAQRAKAEPARIDPFEELTDLLERVKTKFTEPPAAEPEAPF